MIGTCTLQCTLESITARAEIVDVIHRYCHATDRRRWWLMDSVFHEM